MVDEGSTIFWAILLSWHNNNNNNTTHDFNRCIKGLTLQK